MDPQKGNPEQGENKILSEQEELNQIIQRKKIQNKILKEMIDHLQQPPQKKEKKKK